MLKTYVLDLKVLHECNLACESCNVFSDLQQAADPISLEDADRWMAGWSRRIRPRHFTLLGGEPTLHPNLTELVEIAAKHWPRSDRRVTTNGFFLHHHRRLPAVLALTGTRLLVSVHFADPEDAPESLYGRKIKRIQRILEQWEEVWNVRVTFLHTYKNWTRRYQGTPPDIRPYQSDPRKAWSVCPGRNCTQLVDGNLARCQPAAYLPRLAGIVKLGEEWNPYLGYQTLPPTCTNEELVAFYKQEEMPECAGCPYPLERFKKPNPML